MMKYLCLSCNNTVLVPSWKYCQECTLRINYKKDIKRKKEKEIEIYQANLKMDPMKRMIQEQEAILKSTAYNYMYDEDTGLVIGYSSL